MCRLSPDLLITRLTSSLLCDLKKTSLLRYETRPLRHVSAQTARTPPPTSTPHSSHGRDLDKAGRGGSAYDSLYDSGFLRAECLDRSRNTGVEQLDLHAKWVEGILEL